MLLDDLAAIAYSLQEMATRIGHRPECVPVAVSVSALSLVEGPYGHVDAARP